MPKISKEEKKVQEEGESYRSRFTTMFSNDTLRKIYDEEILTVPNWELISKMLLKEQDAKDEQFTQYIPKSCAYVKQNIFRTSGGEFYLSSWDGKSFYAKEYTKEILVNTYINFFPQILKKWFSVYSKVYFITCNQKKPRVFEEGGVAYLNLFSGFPLDGVERDKEIIKKNMEHLEKFWVHIKAVLCNNNLPVFQYFQKWIRALVGGKRKMKTAPYMKGTMGAGKGVLLNLITNILGPQNIFRVQNANEILGNFNGHLASKLFVYIDDVKLNDQQFRDLYQVLKVYITEPTNSYRDLFKKSVNLANLLSLFLISNHDILKLEASAGEERRIFFLDIATLLKDKAYYDYLYELIDNIAFQKAFLWECEDKYDPLFNEGAEIKLLPQTDSYISSAQHSITPVISFFKSLCEEKEKDFNEPRRPKELYQLYVDFYMDSSKQYDKKRVQGFTHFSDEIKKYGFVKFKTNMRYKGSDPTTYILLNKDKCVGEYKKRGFLSDIEIEDLNIKPKTKHDLLLQESQRMKELQKDMREAQEAFLKLSKEIMEENRKVQEKNKPIFTAEDEKRATDVFKQSFLNSKYKTKVLDFVPKSKDEVLDMMSLRLF